jgi:hypothetical protein
MIRFVAGIAVFFRDRLFFFHVAIFLLPFAADCRKTEKIKKFGALATVEPYLRKLLVL